MENVQPGDFIHYEIGHTESDGMKSTYGYGYVLDYGFHPESFYVTCVSGGYMFKPNDVFTVAHSLVRTIDGDTFEYVHGEMFD